MTSSDGNQSTPWYKHTLFLVVLNIIGGVISYLGADLMFHSLLLTGGNSYLGTEGFSNIVIVTTLIGTIIGGTLGYSLWATTDNFPQSRAVLLSGLWAGTLGMMLLIASTIGCFGLAFPIISFFVTLGLLEKWDQGWSIFKGVQAKVVRQLVAGFQKES